MWFAFFCEGERSVVGFGVTVDVDLDVDSAEVDARDDDDGDEDVEGSPAFALRDTDWPSCRALLFDGRESTGDARFVQVVGVRVGVSNGDEEEETGGSSGE